MTIEDALYPLSGGSAIILRENISDTETKSMIAGLEGLGLGSVGVSILLDAQEPEVSQKEPGIDNNTYLDEDSLIRAMGVEPDRKMRSRMTRIANIFIHEDGYNSSISPRALPASKGQEEASEVFYDNSAKKLVFQVGALRELRDQILANRPDSNDDFNHTVGPVVKDTIIKLGVVLDDLTDQEG